MRVAISLGALLVLVILCWILIDILLQAVPILSFDLLIGEPKSSGRSGGIGSIILSTTLLLGVTLVVAVPLSLAAAIALSEHTMQKSNLAKLIRRSLDVLAAVPSIVFGLFGNALFCHLMGMGYSILSGGLTLACMALPIMIRNMEQGLRTVPSEYIHGASALGLSKLTTLLKIRLPACAQALNSGLILGIGRALAETAALIFTAGYVSRTPDSLFDSGRALSVHIYDLALNVPGGRPYAYASALVLIVMLIMVNTLTTRLARLLSKHSKLGYSIGDL